MTDVLRDVPRVEIALSDAELLVHPRGVDKGGLLRQLLSTQGLNGARPDFVLLLGDDESDEPAFAALEAWRAERPAAQAPPAAYGVTVGQRHSRAAWYLDEQAAAAPISGVVLAHTGRSLRHTRSRPL